MTHGLFLPCKNVHTKFGFTTPLCFQIEARTRQTDRQTNGCDPDCGLLGRPQRNNRVKILRWDIISNDWTINKRISLRKSPRIRVYCRGEQTSV